MDSGESGTVPNTADRARRREERKELRHLKRRLREKDPSVSESSDESDVDLGEKSRRLMVRFMKHGLGDEEKVTGKRKAAPSEEAVPRTERPYGGRRGAPLGAAEYDYSDAEDEAPPPRRPPVRAPHAPLRPQWAGYLPSSVGGGQAPARGRYMPYRPPPPRTTAPAQAPPPATKFREV